MRIFRLVLAGLAVTLLTACGDNHSPSLRPDLEVIEVEVEPTFLRTQDSFDVNVSLRNSGQVDVAAVSLGVYLGHTPSMAEQTDLASRPVEALVGANSVVEVAQAVVPLVPAQQRVSLTVSELAFPVATPSGSYTVFVVVDVASVVSELDEQNNVGFFADPLQFINTSQLFLPDLRVQRIRPWPTRWSTNQSLQLDAEIRNGGAGPSGPFEVLFLLSPGNDVCDEEDIDAVVVQVAGLEEFSLMPLVVNLDDTELGLDFDVYYVGAVVDVGRAVEEREEENNTYFSIYPVHYTEQPDPRVDLVVTRVRVEPAVLRVGEWVGVELAVTNESDDPVFRPFVGRVYLSSDLVLDPSDSALATFDYEMLRPNESSFEWADLTLSTNLEPGIYHVLADVEGVVAILITLNQQLRLQ